MELIEYIQNPELMGGASLDELRKLVEEYPFYQSARLLYVKNLFQLHHPSFLAELERASLLIPDRRTLFSFIEGAEYTLTVREAFDDSKVIETEEDTTKNRTISLIDNFLSTQSNDVPDGSSQPHAVPTVAELTSDYATFLALQEDTSEHADDAAPSSDEETRENTLIDSFINETSGKQRYEITSLDIENASTDEADEDMLPSQETRTEVAFNNTRIAELCIKQGRYSEALEIFRKICLNNPEKSANFATQIQLLEKIVEQQQ